MARPATPIEQWIGRNSKEQLEKTARTYFAGNGGQRFNIAGLALRFETHPQRLRRGQRVGWPSLNGEKLHPEPGQFRPPVFHAARKEATFLESEAAQALRFPSIFVQDSNSPGWIDNQTYRSADSALWCSARGGVEAFGFNDLTKGKRRRRRFLAQAERLLGRSITTDRVKPPSPCNVRKVFVFLKKDLAELHELLGRTARNKELQEGHKVSEAFVLRWAKRESIKRPGEKALRRRQWGKRRQRYFKDDVQSILDGNESIWRGPSKYATPKFLDDDAAAAALRLWLTDGPALLSVLKAKAKKLGISRGRLFRAKAKLRVQSCTRKQIRLLAKRDKKAPPIGRDYVTITDAADKTKKEQADILYYALSGLVWSRKADGGERLIHLPDLHQYLGVQQHSKFCYWYFPRHKDRLASLPNSEKSGGTADKGPEAASPAAKSNSSTPSRHGPAKTNERIKLEDRCLELLGQMSSKKAASVIRAEFGLANLTDNDRDQDAVQKV